MLASIIFFVPETYHPVYVFPDSGINHDANNVLDF